MDIPNNPEPSRNDAQIRIWPDPETAPNSRPVMSITGLLAWLPIIGPTATVLAIVIDYGLAHVKPMITSYSRLGGAVGVRHGWKVRAAVERLVRYELATWAGDGELHFKTHWPQPKRREK